MNIAHCSIFSL